MTISERIFDAFLKCSMKCWLCAAHQRPNGNTYAEWLQTESESYRIAEEERLISKFPSGEYVLTPRTNQGGENNSSSSWLKAAKWRLAIDVLLSAHSRATAIHASTAS